jgi:hypothetical protein
MSTVLDTDIFLVQRGATLYQVAAVDLKDVPAPTDILMAQRGASQFQVPYSRLEQVDDADLLLVQRGTTQHRVSGIDLKEYLTSPGGDLWTPADVSPTFWVDASYAASIYVVGDRISQWDSRGKQAVNAVQATVSSQPVYVPAGLNGLGLVSLSGNSGNMVATGISWKPRSAALYFVWLCRYSLSGNPFIPAPILATADNRGQPYDRHSTLVNWDNNSAAGAVDPFPQDMSWCLVSTGADGVTSSAFEFLNGVARPLGVAVRTRGLAVPTAPVQLGRRADGATRFDGDLAEALVIEVPDAVVDPALAATCEGYLAHKWGLVSLLPLGHPYRFAPPTK